MRIVEDDIMALRKKDGKTFSAVYARYAESLVLVISRTLGVRYYHDRWDLLQETFLKVWTNMHYYDASKGSLAQWMYGIARNTTINHVIRRQRQQRREMTAGYPTEQYSNQEPLFSRLDVDMLLKVLSPAELEILRSRYFNGLTQAETGRKFGRSLPMIKKLDRIVLNKLRKEVSTGDGRELRFPICSK